MNDKKKIIKINYVKMTEVLKPGKHKQIIGPNENNTSKKPGKDKQYKKINKSLKESQETTNSLRTWFKN